MNIGLLFGSFNPVHTGHLLLATRLREHAGLDEVWFVVSPHNPHKAITGLAPEQDRLCMTGLALEHHPYLKVCDIEFGLPRPSYTYQTLEVLVRDHPDDRFTLLVGGDNLEKLDTWKHFDTICSLVSILAYQRSGAPRSHPNVRVIELPMVDISATEIRERIKAGRSVRYFVPEKVEAYIREHRLYH